jgi:predicted transcriptional regulator
MIEIVLEGEKTTTIIKIKSCPSIFFKKKNLLIINKMLKAINSLKNKEYASLKKQFILLSHFYIFIFIYLLVYYLNFFFC